jgi:hypothetical protein
METGHAAAQDSAQNIWHGEKSFIAPKPFYIHFRVIGAFHAPMIFFGCSLDNFCGGTPCRLLARRITAPPKLLPPIISHISTFLKLFVQNYRSSSI